LTAKVLESPSDYGLSRQKMRRLWTSQNFSTK
jgi:hypothetical protein